MALLSREHSPSSQIGHWKRTGDTLVFPKRKRTWPVNARAVAGRRSRSRGLSDGYERNEKDCHTFAGRYVGCPVKAPREGHRQRPTFGSSLSLERAFRGFRARVDTNAENSKKQTNTTTQMVIYDGDSTQASSARTSSRARARAPLWSCVRYSYIILRVGETVVVSGDARRVLWHFRRLSIVAKSYRDLK